MYFENIQNNDLIKIQEDELSSSLLEKIYSNPKIIRTAGTIFVIDRENKLIGCITKGDYIRSLNNNENVNINKNCKYIVDDFDKYNTIEKIEIDYPKIELLPIVDTSHKLLGAIRTKKRSERLESEYVKVCFSIIRHNKSYCEYFKRNVSRNIYLCGTDLRIVHGIGKLLLEQKIIDNIQYISFEENHIESWYHLLGNKVYLYKHSAIKKEDATFIFTDPEMYSKRYLCFSNIEKELENQCYYKIEENDNCPALDYKIPDIKALEKKYNVECKYIGIPCNGWEVSEGEKFRICNLHDSYGKKVFISGLEDEIVNKEQYYNEVSMELKSVYNSLEYEMFFKMCDIKTKYINSKDGLRKVPSQKPQNKRNIYIIGPCIVRGIHAADDYTIGGYLQRILNDYECDYNVILCGGVGFFGNYLKWLGEIKVKNGDYIIIIDRISQMKYCDVDMTSNFKKLYESNKQFFYDSPIHCNYLGNKCIATEIYNYIKNEDYFTANNIGNKEVFLDEFHTVDSYDKYENNKELEEYKAYLLKQRVNVEGRVGAIVMNCNPFTLGHQYLIESALKKVSFLYIFVVSEDKSEFKFQDRMKLVLEGTKHLSNIKVIPSGKFIISQNTFSSYFEKSKKQDIIIDTTEDVEIFARHIAPVLGVSVRFLGEEPFDMITRQYNNKMLEILPRYGIDVDIIKRKEVENQVISASKVRKLIEENKIEEIRKFVPICTLEFLIKKYISK